MPIAFFSERLKNAGFRHGFSTKAASSDDVDRMVSVAAGELKGVKQVHSARVVEMRAGASTSEEADAIVSREGVAISIRTADCVPILVADESTGAVAAIHAGWRGVVSGVVPNAVEMLARDRSKWIAAIGPCICGTCFEVGADVAEQIANASDASVITKRVGEKAFVDLRRAVRIQLTRLGVLDSAIEDVAGCTYHEKALFFSYRRDGANAGRLIAAIVPHPTGKA
jgi:polyphenol oxidase